MPDSTTAAPAPARCAIRFSELFVVGSFVPALSGRTFVTTNPATGQPLAEIAEAGREDVDRAVAAARRAYETGAWPKMHARERGKLLVRIAERLLARADEGATLETLDNGKPLFGSRQVDGPPP